MIGLYKDDGTRLTISYNSLDLNKSSDGTTSTYEVNTVQSLSSVEAVRENRPQGDGSMSSLPRKTQRIIRLRGMIRATTYASLFDKAETLAYKTDPSRTAFYNPTNPYLALDFSVPTADTTTWPTGLIPCRYYAVAVGSLDAVTDYGNGKVIPFSIDFHLRDPRRYAQTATSRTGTGSITHDGDYPSYPTITIAATGAGSATYSVANTTLGITMTLNLSGLVNTDSVVIDMDAQTVKKNGSDAASLIVGTPGWFYIGSGSTTITVTNGTNMTTTTSFRSAWAD